MDNEKDTHTEIKIGNMIFQVITHFKESEGATIESTLIKLMEQETENLLIDIDSS